MAAVPVTPNVDPSPSGQSHRGFGDRWGVPAVAAGAGYSAGPPAGDHSRPDAGLTPFMITESVRPPCTLAPTLHGELTLSAILVACWPITWPAVPVLLSRLPVLVTFGDHTGTSQCSRKSEELMITVSAS